MESAANDLHTAENGYLEIMPEIEFDADDSTPGLQASILTLSGEALAAKVGQDVIIDQLKSAVARRLGIDDTDFSLLSLAQNLVLDGGALVSSCMEETGVATMFMSRHITLEKYESEAGASWQALAATLQDKDIDDETALVSVRDFLSNYPSMINLQTRYADSEKFKPILSFAVEGVEDTKLRQKCVDELLSRGARIHIRHSHGFLIDEAEKSGSGFVPYLQEKGAEFREYEVRAIAAWRNVSSKLCGETSQQVSDEDEMTKIVKDFCEKYPAMVNFQNNHACDEMTDVPYGYFGYAPLLTFSGGRACRRRRGSDDETQATRFGSFQELLRHGARVDIAHGGKTVLTWMRSEGSHLVDWLESQFKKPMPEHVPFEFTRETK